MLKKTALLAGAGLAIYAAYRYSKMSGAEKDELRNNVKEKGKSLAERFSPEKIKQKWDEATAGENFKPGY